MAVDYFPITLRSAMRTDVGMVRPHNEDSAYVDDESSFFIVADGMGGHAAGEVASAMAVENVRDALIEAREDIRQFGSSPSEEGRQNLIAILETAVRSAHKAVFDRGSAESDKQGMGTTLDVVLLAGAEAFIAHVGDSRTYLLRDEGISQITTDHTFAEILVIEGKLSAEDALVSPYRTVLVNAIGVAQEVGVEMAHILLKTGDQFLMCSDGLHDYFPKEKELGEKIFDHEPGEALETLVDLAKERGGSDNITGIVFEVLTAPEHAGETSAAAEAGPQGSGPKSTRRDDTQPVGAIDDDDDDEKDDGRKKTLQLHAKPRTEESGTAKSDTAPSPSSEPTQPMDTTGETPNLPAADAKDSAQADGEADEDNDSVPSDKQSSENE